MGNSTSADQQGHDDDPFDGADTLGYRVLGVQPNSPASKAGLVSFLDFLVGAQGKMLLGSGEDLEEGDEYDDVDLPALLKEHVNQQIEFCKYYSCGKKSKKNECEATTTTCVTFSHIHPLTKTPRSFIHSFLFFPPQWSTTSRAATRDSSNSRPKKIGVAPVCWASPFVWTITLEPKNDSFAS